MSKLDSVLVSMPMLEDPRLIELARDVRYMHIEALAWAGAHHTDGYISRAALRRLTDEPDAALGAATLVSAGLWESTETGWQIVGYLDSQISAQDAERITEANALRNRRYRQHRLGDHSLCERCPAVKGKVAPSPPGYTSPNASRDASRDDPRIDSTRRDSPRGEEEAIEAPSTADALEAPPPPPTIEPYAMESRSTLETKLRWAIERAKRERSESGRVTSANARLAADARARLNSMGISVEEDEQVAV